jgi:hypothetical protein
MDQKVKRKWIAALRSGKFKQARETLLDKDTGAMCCLGVLAHIQVCDLTRLKNLEKVTPPRGYAAGLAPKDAKRLASMNDGHDWSAFMQPKIKKLSFKGIASYIEKNL